MTISERLKAIREALELPEMDCGDNSCNFSKRKSGMRTNGGCRCAGNMSRGAISLILRKMRTANDYLTAIQASIESAECDAEDLALQVGYALKEKAYCEVSNDDIRKSGAIKLITAALLKAGQREWLDISSAPKDGSDILVVNDRGCAVVFWCDEDNWWIVQDHKMMDRPLRGSTPTHWQPLPSPPSSQEGVG